MKPGTMGGKTLSYWEHREKQIKGLINKLILMGENATKDNNADIAAAARQDIDALIDVLVVLEYEMDQHFERKPKETGKRSVQ